MSFSSFPTAGSRLSSAVLSACFLVASIVLVAAGSSGSTEKMPGQISTGARGISQTTAAIMAEAAKKAPRAVIYVKRELEVPGVKNRPQDPGAVFESRFPSQAKPPVAANTSSANNPSPKYPQ